MTKNVLVTGSSRGIGAAIVRELSAYGYNVIINYHHSREQAYALAEQIQTSHAVRCMVIQADVSREEEVDAMVHDVEEELGGVDILINNAGIDLSNLFQLKTADEFRRTMDVNVVGAYNCAMRTYRHMKEQNYGRIINISSINGINTYYPMSIDYDASKAAMISLTHDLAVQLSPEVHVNAIAPGFIGTESELDGYDETFLKEECEKILVKRYGKPEEVAHLVRFLISEEADFINNTVIRIDGGQMGSC
ncbi:MAG: SDR family oxidoreductase [Solobacterium sp.]|jgi:3-oxoacyl-[acyl-carrier protein] reductase|nr:SDR family oxidoreductase [Solobacterium sp.]MCH4048363.1 SDR family oxidoreductase [Solobacterium sp.]MCH4074785.1 SDR family oxidoreductase [Solobacterium sp.]MCI1314758.1 SDR family oxidoreductase [Solobacterium sp.]MCI1347127.1 SDR family oxidoreductase [Solobacterium sp.]